MGDADAEGGPLIGTLLRIPSSVVAEATEHGLAAAGYEDVRAAHLPVLQPLFTRPEGARITDLAAWAHVTKPAMVYLVNHLETHGYVERVADPVDGRAQQVRLTERGVEVIQCVRGIVRQTEVNWAERIGAPEMAELKRLLRRLSATLEGNVAGT